MPPDIYPEHLSQTGNLKSVTKCNSLCTVYQYIFNDGAFGRDLCLKNIQSAEKIFIMMKSKHQKML